MKITMKKNAGLILALAVAFLSVNKLQAQNEGEAAPDFEVSLLSGETFKLSSHQGKVVLIFWFGNACPSCKAVGADIESQVYQKFMNDEGFTAIGLDTWPGSSTSSVGLFKNQSGISFSLGLNAADIAQKYGTTYDRLMVIDRDGNILHKGTVLARNDLNNAADIIEQSLMIATGNGEIRTAPEVSVYPNPAADHMYLQSQEDMLGVGLYDMSGKQVYREVGLTGTELQLNVETLSEGLYFYRVNTRNGEERGKILIQR